MIDNSLQLQFSAPAANTSQQNNGLDLGIDQPGFSNQWRQGRLRIAWPAFPNLTSPTDNITFTLQDSPDGINFSNCGLNGAPSSFTPLIQVQVPGVASTGAAAGSVDIPIPPFARGPIGLLTSATANAGNNTLAGIITASWVNE